MPGRRCSVHLHGSGPPVACPAGNARRLVVWRPQLAPGTRRDRRPSVLPRSRRHCHRLSSDQEAQHQRGLCRNDRRQQRERRPAGGHRALRDTVGERCPLQRRARGPHVEAREVLREERPRQRQVPWPRPTRMPRGVVRRLLPIHLRPQDVPEQELGPLERPWHPLHRQQLNLA